MKRKLGKLFSVMVSLTMALSLFGGISWAEEAAAADDSVYVIMNIPYAEFYAAELDNDVEVDTVSSATNNKWSAQSGTYYEAAETGGTILGVSYPVMTTLSALEALGAAEAESEDALAEAGDYAYYIYDAADYESDDEEEEDDTETSGPGGSMGGSSTVYDDYDYSYYKILTVTDGEASFSAAVYVNGATELTDADVSLSDSSQYGDYQLEVSADTDGTVFGVIITAVDEEGNETDYGLRALENIWRSGSQLSWSVGYSTTEKHGNTLSYEHYASMEGSTITMITYITSAGLYTISDLELEVTGADESSDSDSDSGIPDGEISGGPDSDSGTTYAITAVSAEDGETISSINDFLEGTATVDQLPDGTTYIINFDLTEEGAEYITSVTVNGTEATISDGTVTFDVSSVDDPVLASAYIESMETTVEFYLVLSEITEEDGDDDGTGEDTEDGTDDDVEDGTDDDTDNGSSEDTSDDTEDNTDDSTTPPELPDGDIAEGGTGDDTDTGTDGETEDGTDEDSDNGSSDDTGDDTEDNTDDSTTPPELPDGDITEDGTGEDTDGEISEDTEEGTDDSGEENTGSGTDNDADDSSDDETGDESGEGSGDGTDGETEDETTPPELPDGDIAEDGTDDETEDGEGSDDSTDDDGTVTPPADNTESSDSESSEDTSDTDDAEDTEGSGSDDTSGDVSTGDASDVEDTAESESDGAGTGDASDTDTAGSDEASGEAGTGDTSGSEEAADADSTDTDDDDADLSDDDADLSDDDAESSDTSDDEDNSSSDDAAEVGDSSNMIFWMVLAVLTLVSLAGASIKRKFS